MSRKKAILSNSELWKKPKGKCRFGGGAIPTKKAGQGL